MEKPKKNNEHHLKSCLRGVRQSYQSYGRSSTWSAGIIHTHLHKSYFPYGQQTVSSGILWILGSSGCFHLLWTNPILEVSRVVDGLMMAETIEFHKDVKPHHEWLARGPQEACTCYVYLWVAHWQSARRCASDVPLDWFWIITFYFGHSMVFTNHSTFHANLLSTILSFWTPDRSLFSSPCSRLSKSRKRRNSEECDGPKPRKTISINSETASKKTKDMKNVGSGWELVKIGSSSFWILLINDIQFIIHLF